MNGLARRCGRRAIALGAIVWLGLAFEGAAGFPQFKIENPAVGYPTREMGYSVCVDGDTMVAGAPESERNGQSGAGAAHVYRANGQGGWTFEAELVASDAAAHDRFGWSVSVWGNVVVVGAPYDDDDRGIDAGSAYVFTRSGGVWTQQAKLTSPDVVANDWFGRAVSVSGDTIVVGAPLDDGRGRDAGSAYVFTRSGGVWAQQAKLTAADAAAWHHFGWSVSVSGGTLAVGAPDDDHVRFESGSAYVFTRTGGAWIQQAKLTAADAAAWHHFGWSVSVSGDTLAIGAPYDAWWYKTGSAYVFVRTGGAWAQEAKIAGPDPVETYFFFGSSVSVSGDTLAIGVPYDHSVSYSAGSAYVFTRAGGAWAKQAKLTAADGAAEVYFGWSVSVSGDTLVVGAPYDDSGGQAFGSAYVFALADGAWTQKAELFAAPAFENRFGRSVSVSGDTVVLGAPGCFWKSEYGTAYVFTRSGREWIQQARLIASDAEKDDHFGYSVSVSGDTALIGAYMHNNGERWSGSAYVFTRESGVWTQQAQLAALDAGEDDLFGYSVSVSGNIAVIGAYGDNDGGFCGSAYVFARSDGLWTQEVKLTAPESATNEGFGHSVSVSGDMIVVGAFGEGSAYVFARSGGAWTQQAKLTAADSAAGDDFGHSVSISGDTVVVGAPDDDDRGTDSGSAYVFTRSGGVWTQQAKLTARDGAAGDQFGFRSVSVSGDMVAVGAHHDEDGGYYAGSAYVFIRSGERWTQLAKLTAADIAPFDFFGDAVAAGTGRVVCGARGNDGPETNSGAAYVFDLCTSADNWALFR